MKLYVALASAILARENCMKSGNVEWRKRHTERLQALVREHMPSGSGFDNGTKLEIVSCKPDRLVFHTDFHHMNEVGMYDGWTSHGVYVTASLVLGYDLRITGPNRNDIKDYISQAFSAALDTELDAPFAPKASEAQGG